MTYICALLLTLSSMKHIFYSFFYLLFLTASLSACKKDNDDQTQQPAPVQQDTKVTADNYLLIQTGMTLNQVIAILGQGKQVTTNNYTWSADDSNSIVINITFANGAVQSKTHAGLYIPPTGGSTTGGSSPTTGGCPSSYNGHTVYTGPRGGCYYINKNNNKTYI